MEKSENSKEADNLYMQVCKLIKKNGNSTTVPTKESFMLKYSAFKELVEGHKLLLTAIGKL
jgi:hypothetical protein